jgi:hypothetical protein
MNMIETSRKAPAEMPDANEHPQREEALDEAIADSMIASDPPAAVSKGQPTAPARRPRIADKGPAKRSRLIARKRYVA